MVRIAELKGKMRDFQEESQGLKDNENELARSENKVFENRGLFSFKDFFNSTQRIKGQMKTKMPQVKFPIRMARALRWNRISLLIHLMSEDSKVENADKGDEGQLDYAMGKTRVEYEMKVLCSMTQRMILPQLEMKEVLN
ncbi:hypothetical protein GH714_014314 [Hevea brasiliensis]|uniref:Uncharacterized protein n=1 Tax=Hevea brasiliensis TaxID=3981 RepID=A0A6A6L9I1_HEVBR|nr:hypothetical protein GH714_014314 [Hevea brasiliensis]